MSLHRKISLCIVAAVSLANLLVSPVWLSAQVDKTDLSLRLIPGDYYSGIEAGKRKTVFIEVSNNSNKTLNHIRFDADKPEGWSIAFRPDSLEMLASGGSTTIDAEILPSSTAGRGDVTIAFIAEADETRTATSLFLRVEGGSPFWIWVGAGIAFLVVIGFIIVFLRSGR